MKKVVTLRLESRIFEEKFNLRRLKTTLKYVIT